MDSGGTTFLPIIALLGLLLQVICLSYGSIFLPHGIEPNGFRLIDIFFVLGDEIEVYGIRQSMIENFLGGKCRSGSEKDIFNKIILLIRGCSFESLPLTKIDRTTPKNSSYAAHYEN